MSIEKSFFEIFYVFFQKKRLFSTYTQIFCFLSAKRKKEAKKAANNLTQTL